VLTALVDTGHSLTDVLTGRDVIIIERKSALHIAEVLPTANDVDLLNLPKGFRLIPYSVVGGHGLLPAFVPDKIELLEGDNNIEISSAMLGVSEEPLGEDYKGIISPTVLAK
jgi:stage II sporulation protein GA (sporulation sigma-E factor processing peptidase)